MSKIFIIGLPRTGTTSISVALLGYDFKVAHTAYTKRAFELADVISDAPCFCDYQQLDQLFPNSKFVYLDRELGSWTKSIQMLLTKMLPELDAKTGYLHPILKRCFSQTFNLLTVNNPLDQQHLASCYLQHQYKVTEYFSNKNNFIKINISNRESFRLLLNFLNIEHIPGDEFPQLNRGKTVDDWKEYKHPNKINSLSAGKDHRKFFDY